MLKTVKRSGVELDLAGAAATAFGTRSTTEVEQALLRLHTARAQAKGWTEEQKEANQAAFAILHDAGDVQVTLALDPVRELDATPVEYDTRKFDVDAARLVLTGEVMGMLLKDPAIDPKKFDAAVEAGLISQEVASKFVGVANHVTNVDTTERTVLQTL